MKALTHSRLREVLDYDPETGVFTRRISTANGRYKPGPTGSENDRYCFLWIDNLNGHDNRWVNLREATGSQNSANKGKLSNNTSGFKGVSYVKDPAKCGSKPWRASIMKDGKRHRLGLFATPEEAAAAYQKKAVELHGEFARAA